MGLDVMTLPEVAKYLRLAEKTAYRLAAEGKLPGFKVGGSWRFLSADIEARIDRKKAEIGGERVNTVEIEEARAVPMEVPHEK